MKPAGLRCLPVLLLALQLPAWAQEIPAEALPAGSNPMAGLASVPALAASEPAAAAPAEPAAEVGRGLASWYGPRFHGRRTASGERFDMHALTAAHPFLPFGSVVRVENPATGRSVDVRINDRGPHIRQRIIDLSRAAARALGLLDDGSGTNPVVLKLLKRPD